MEKRIEDALIAIGIPAGISGFNYIKDVVLILDRDGMKIKWMEAYAQIGQKYGKTRSQVERGIRHAFEVVRSCKAADYDVVNHYIGFIYTDNANSISLIYRTIKREMEEENPDVKCSDERSVLSEKRVREIVKETIKEILGGIA